MANQICWRLENAEISGQFLEWAATQRADGVQLIVLEGLLGSGKSHLLSAAGETGIDLDDFLPKGDGDEIVPWTNYVLAGGCLNSTRSALRDRGFAIVGGAVAWPVLQPIVAEIAAKGVRRTYLKRVTEHNGHVVWGDGEGLLDHAAASAPYFRSIYEYHGRDMPWLFADLVVERIDRD